MFSPVYVGSRGKQPFTFIASLALQGVLVALLCLMPKTQACLRMNTLHTDELRSELVTPLYFLDHITQAPTVAKPGSRAPRPTLQEASIPELPSGQMDAVKMMEELAKQAEASPSEPQAEVQPAEEATTVAEASTSGESEGGLAPFARWQMNSGSTGYGFVHHQIKSALPVFTPEPPILHGGFPEPARGKEVVMNVVINEEGSIVAVKVLQGIGYGVENSIVETLRRWIYVPAKVNGKAIASQKELRFQFPG